jgi:hypothetical protein
MGEEQIDSTKKKEPEVKKDEKDKKLKDEKG